MKIAYVLLLASSSCVACFTVPDDDENTLLQTNKTLAMLAPPNKGGDDCRDGEDLPCELCINSRRDANSADWMAAYRGAGYDCCASLSTKELALQPLCGVCLRVQGNALGKKAINRAGGDLSNRFSSECADVYCQAADGVDKSLLEKIARNCDPQTLGVFHGDAPTGLFSIIANNPKKYDLEDFLKKYTDSFLRYSGYITGTASSSKLCMLTTGAEKASVCTKSGPYGGDAELGGILANDYVNGYEAGDGKASLDGLIFFNDEDEAHKLDIKALKNIVEFTMPRGKYGLSTRNEGPAKDVLRNMGIGRGRSSK